MNFLSELVKKANGRINVKNAIAEKEVFFQWKNGLSLEKINEFEKETDICIPEYYKAFLLLSNGGVIFNSDEDDGYELLGLDEIKSYTEELKSDGYDIPEGCYCFLKCFFCDDILLFDTKKKSNIILDGDVGYPVDEWEYLKMDLNAFFVRLVQCNGAMYWRW